MEDQREDPPSIAKVADWYWLIYPEIEPPRGGKYYLASYDAGGTISGGITAFRGTNNTLLMCEDHWLTRRLAEEGRGPVYPLAQQTYIPYWLQHEFSHDHFGRNAHLKLEVESHQWFDRAKWPTDFVGRFEPDYYQESMFKRLQTQAKPSLAAYFIRRSVWSEGVLAKLRPEDFVGRYAVAKAENEWHSGQIQMVQGNLEWINDAGASWGLTLSANGVLKTDKRNPYFEQSPHFEAQSATDAAGIPTNGIGGFKFGGQVFLRQP